MIYNPPLKRRKRWPLLFSIILIILVIFSFLILLWYKDSLLPPSQAKKQKVFIIKTQESGASIANHLEEEGLIKNSFAFRLYLKLKGLDSKIQTGDFKLFTNMNASEIAGNLTHGVMDVWVTFPEGWRMEEMGELLNKKLGINVSDFVSNSKEGYMFPDTYLIPVDATAVNVANILLNNFHKRLKEAGLAETSSKDLSFAEKIILASIIEREAKDGLTERATIAGILINRLTRGVALEVDATVQYDQGKSGSWWPKLTQEKLKIDSPSNTYTRPGLPPSPICNPGIQSIQAAFNPIKTDYFYYLHGKDGQIHYAKILEEHNQNAAKYLN